MASKSYLNVATIAQRRIRGNSPSENQPVEGAERRPPCRFPACDAELLARRDDLHLQCGVDRNTSRITPTISLKTSSMSGACPNFQSRSSRIGFAVSTYPTQAGDQAFWSGVRRPSPSRSATSGRSSGCLAVHALLY
jgi:hypothetical protein